MEKTETLYTSVYANNALESFIYQIIFDDKYTSDRIIDPIINKSLKFSLIKYMILSMKEDIILKPKNSTYTNNLLFSAIESLVEKIAEINSDGSIYLGGHLFPDGNTLVAAIRNKFAHGDYTYSDNCDFVNINFDGDEVPVSINALLDFAIDMLDKKHEYKIANEHTKPLCIVAGRRKINSMGIVSDEFMKDILDSYIEYVFDMSSENGYIPKEAYECFDTAKEKLRKTADYYRDSSTKYVMDKIAIAVKSFVEFFNEKSKNNGWDVSLSCTKTELSEEDKYKVIDTFKKIKGGKPNYYDTVNELPYYATRTKNSDYNKVIGVRRCAELLACLDIMFGASTGDIQSVGNYISFKTREAITIDQDIYTMVQVLRLLDLSYLFENFVIDYSKLPLSSFNPTVWEREDAEVDEMINTADASERRIKSLELTIDKLNNQIDGVYSKNMPEDKKHKILSLLFDNLQALYLSKCEAESIHELSEAKAYELMQDREDNKEYYDNKCLLERLRDSISHGNVYTIPNGQIPDTIVRFEDKFKDKIVFSVDIKLKDLIIILDECTKTLSREEIKIRTK